MKIYIYIINRRFPMPHIAYLVAVVSTFIMLASCKKFIEVDAPVNNINTDNVYTNDVTAASVVTGIYQKMSFRNSDQFNSTGALETMYTNTGLSADELILFDESSTIFRPYYTNNLLSTDPIPGYWMNIYPTIFAVNAVIEGVENNSVLTPAVQQQLLGEAKFLRAFNYFYLVNFYGDVPLILGTDYKQNSLLPRASTIHVYEQIIGDLKDAQTLLSEQYLQGDALTAYAAGGEERVRPTKWAAIALLARVYLYTGDFTNAEAAATAVLNNTSYFTLTTLENTFLKNNREAIWQLMSVNTDISANTGEGKFFILSSDGPGTENPVYLSNDLINSFEVDDQRRTNWTEQVTVAGTTYYFPYKYKTGAVSTSTMEYSTILRVGELYLIRAEARAQLGNLSGAAEDLNMIRGRAGLPGTTATTEPDMLKAILQERRVELFTEWGHRWFDLIRTGNANTVLAPVKGTDWQTTDQLYPIPQSEILKSPGLKGHQNPGYN